MLSREEVGRVHVVVAGQTELRSVGSAEQNRRSLVAEVARNSLGGAAHDYPFEKLTAFWSEEESSSV